MTAPIEGSAVLESRYREIHRVTLVGALVNAIVAVVKLVAGVVGNSQALIADGIHSVADLASDFLVLFAAKHGAKEADENHPYGHGRIETLATLGLGVALVATGLGIGWDAVVRLRSPELLLVPGSVALAVAFVSIFAKEWVFQYTIRVARRLKSALLEANAWHSRSDAIASIVAVVGIAGAMAGYPKLDAIAAIGVAFMIAKIGWDLAWHGAHELIDTGLAPEELAEIRTAILSVDGVRAVHGLRTRKMAGGALVDVHVLVDTEISVSEGHYISDSVYSRVVNRVGDIRDMLVHIDPEDDELLPRPVAVELPMRSQITAQLEVAWSHIEEARQIEKLTLHYLHGGIHAEVLLPLALFQAPEQGHNLVAELTRAAEEVPTLKRLSVHFG